MKPTRVQRRATITATLVITALAAAALFTHADGAPARTDHYRRSAIAQTALRYAGRWGGQACADAHHDASGQCKQFVNCVLSLASGGHQYPVDASGNYQKSFAAAGGIEIDAATAGQGDVIQIGQNDAASPLHIAIVLANRHDGSFDVVDANWVGWPTTPELVGTHSITPPRQALFWRMAALDGPAATQATGVDTSDATPLLPPQLTMTTGQQGTVAATVTAGPPNGTALGTGGAKIRFYVDGHPVATVNALPGPTTTDIPVPSGSHQITAQSITAQGYLSPTSAPVASARPSAASQDTAAPPTPSASGPTDIAITVPGAPLVAGVVPIHVKAARAGSAIPRLLVDGTPTQATIEPGGQILNWDAATSRPGAHTLVIEIPGTTGHIQTSAPITVTVADAAFDHRITLDTDGDGRADLIAVDSAGALVLYQGTPTGFTGGVRLADHDFAGIKTLLGGSFTTPGVTQIIAIGADGHADLYNFDAPGRLSTPRALDPALGTAKTLIAGRFSGTDTSEILAIGATGQATNYTFGANLKLTASRPFQSPPVAIQARWLMAADISGAGNDELLAISAEGVVTALAYLQGQGFAQPYDLGRAALPSSRGLTLGYFAGGPYLQFLYTDSNGITRAADRPGWSDTKSPRTGVVFG